MMYMQREAKAHRSSAQSTTKASYARNFNKALDSEGSWPVSYETPGGGASFVSLDKLAEGTTGHSFGRVQIFDHPSATDHKACQDKGDPPPAVGPPSPTTASDDLTPLDAPAAAKIPTLSLSGTDSYSGTAESHENITYTVEVPAGANVKDFGLVQWTKGYAKNGDGNFFRAKLYGSVADINFADWQIDSPDADPIYRSNDKARWNYTKSGNKFTSEDDPGPALSSEKGADYSLKFKVAVYDLASVPTTTTGTISTSPLTGFKFWNYSVAVAQDGTFSHPVLK